MRGNVRNSAALLWRHQRLLWWIAALNLALAWLSSLGLRAALRPILDHSLESARLVTGFDVSTLVMLQQRPEAPMRAAGPGVITAALIYLIAMLVLDGGVLVSYLDDRRLSLSEFSASCGQYFWRMARLSLYSLAPLGLLAAAHSAVSKYADRLSHDATQERLGLEVKAAATLLVLLVALLVRLCFDLAQARVVRSDRPAVMRELLRSFTPALRSGLYWQYLGIVVLAKATFAVGVALWIYLPHQAMLAGFAVLELMTIALIAARLWMKAASARWVALQPEDAIYIASENAPAPLPELNLDQPQPELGQPE